MDSDPAPRCPPCSWGTRRASGGPRRLRNACGGKAGCRDAPTHSTARRHVPWGWSVHTSAAELLPEIHMLKPSPRPRPPVPRNETRFEKSGLCRCNEMRWAALGQGGLPPRRPATSQKDGLGKRWAHGRPPWRAGRRWPVTPRDWSTPQTQGPGLEPILPAPRPWTSGLQTMRHRFPLC